MKSSTASQCRPTKRSKMSLADWRRCESYCMRGTAAQRFNVAYFGPYFGWYYIGQPVLQQYSLGSADCSFSAAAAAGEQLPLTDAMNLLVGTKACLVQQPRGMQEDHLMSTEEALELTESACAENRRRASV